VFDELKKLWYELDFTQRIWAILLLPFSLGLGIICGLFLIFWNKYGLVFSVGVILILLTSEENPSEIMEQAQALALLISIIFLIRRVYKKSKNES
jgi:hypothetical protein